MKMNRRSASARSSVGSTTTSRAQNSFRVEELKTKIHELEEVLLQEKAERETVYSRVSQINFLEGALDRERAEKQQLLAKLKVYETGTPLLDADSSCPTPDGAHRRSTSSGESNKDGSGYDTFSDRATMVESPSVDDWRRLKRDSESRTDALESKISALEQEIENRDMQLAAYGEEAFRYQILELQNAVTELKLGKEALRNENEALSLELKKYKESFKTVKARSQTLERKLSGRKTKLEVYESQMSITQDKLTRSNEEVEQKNKLLIQKARELEDVWSKLKSTESHLQECENHIVHTNRQMELCRLEVEQVRGECEQIQAKAQHERWQSEKQITALERDNRRGKRIVAALETSLQDLKISLEEKAMENDELNRSIQKVMEQANETIEGAKRHSLYIASPVMSPLPMSPVQRPASATTIRTHHPRRSQMRNSAGGYISSHPESHHQQPYRNSFNSILNAAARAQGHSENQTPLSLLENSVRVDT